MSRSILIVFEGGYKCCNASYQSALIGLIEALVAYAEFAAKTTVAHGAAILIAVARLTAKAHGGGRRGADPGLSPHHLGAAVRRACANGPSSRRGHC
jgi:hypothetical protein